MQVYFYTPEKDASLRLCQSNDLIGLTKGLDFWIHQTYFYLQQFDSKVDCSVVDTVPLKGIIVFHKGYFPKHIEPNSNQYFICVQADYGRHRFAQMHIDQNPAQLTINGGSKQALVDRLFSFTSNVFVAHWPQPGIMQRDKFRGAKIENVAFFGNPEQFPQYQMEAIKGIIEEVGFTLQLKLTPDEWADYGQTDIALAIRRFDNSAYYNKPFSKVLNAVLAGSLIIAGNESANMFFKDRYYNELPVVASIDEIRTALLKIKQNPVLAFTYLQNCREQIQDLTFERIATKWEDVFQEAGQKLEQWQNYRQRKLYLQIRSL